MDREPNQFGVPEYVRRFMRESLPNLLKMDPPKTEPSTPQPELKIDNPYIPLARNLNTEFRYDAKFRLDQRVTVNGHPGTIIKVCHYGDRDVYMVSFDAEVVPGGICIAYEHELKLL